MRQTRFTVDQIDAEVFERLEEAKTEVLNWVLIG